MKEFYHTGNEILLPDQAKSIKDSFIIRILVENPKSITERWNGASLGCDALKVFCCIEYEETDLLNS